MSHAKTILLVEDELAIRRGLTSLLEGKGYVVSSAGNGREALAYLRSHPPPNVILLDLQMPVMDGWQFREQQLQDLALADIAVVVLSGIADAASRADVLGDVGYLQKPFDANELAAAVERFATVPKPQILMVEDDSEVLKMLGVALRHYGFAVHLAGGGKQAVEIYEQRCGAIDVVLLDVQMPDMDGPETLAALQQLDPTVRCCFMSGNVGKYAGVDLLAMGAAHVFDKPFFSLTDLACTLWQVAER